MNQQRCCSEANYVIFTPSFFLPLLSMLSSFFSSFHPSFLPDPFRLFLSFQREHCTTSESFFPVFLLGSHLLFRPDFYAL